MMSCCVCRHFLAGGTSSSGTSHDSWSPCGFHWGGGRQPGRCTRVWTQSLTQWWHRTLDFFFLWMLQWTQLQKKSCVTWTSSPAATWKYLDIVVSEVLREGPWQKRVDDDCNFYVRFFFLCVNKLYCLSGVTGLLKRNSMKFKAVLQCGKLEFIKELKKTTQNNFRCYTLINGGADLLEHSGHQGTPTTFDSFSGLISLSGFSFGNIQIEATNDMKPRNMGCPHMSLNKRIWQVFVHTVTQQIENQIQSHYIKPLLVK